MAFCNPVKIFNWMLIEKLKGDHTNPMTKKFVKNVKKIEFYFRPAASIIIRKLMEKNYTGDKLSTVEEIWQYYDDKCQNGTSKTFCYFTNLLLLGMQYKLSNLSGNCQCKNC